ncbi:hypothetical protein BJX62DRAFT_216108 [Aspergillus germanicus]
MSDQQYSNSDSNSITPSLRPRSALQSPNGCGALLITTKVDAVCSKIHRRDLAFRLLDLPPKIRLQIYRFAIGYRTLHVRSTNEIDRPYRNVSRFLHWKYFVCKCDVATHPTLSEYAVGRNWAGDVDDNTAVDTSTGG